MLGGLDWIEHVTGDLHQPLHCVASRRVLSGYRRCRRQPYPCYRSRSARPPGSAARILGCRHYARDLKGPGSRAQRRHRGDLTSLALRQGARPASPVVSNLKVEDWVRSGADSADKIVYASLKPNETLTREYAGAQAEFCREQAVRRGSGWRGLISSRLCTDHAQTAPESSPGRRRRSTPPSSVCPGRSAAAAA